MQDQAVCYERVKEKVITNVEVKCVPRISPYGSASTTLNQSVSIIITDYVCVSNYKWNDNTTRSSVKNANCTMNTDLISASWVAAGGKTCIGMKKL